LPKILMIEGSKRARERMVFALEQAEFGVVTAANVTQGLSQLGKNHPHLVILSDSPSAVNTDEFCAQVRQVSSVPIIVISSGKDELTSVRFLQMGADAYMPRPVSLVELVARVRSLLRRTHGLTSKPAQKKRAQHRR